MIAGSSNYPHMISEVIEAIHLMYEDYPDVETDCMLYLSHIVEKENCGYITKWFNEHDRCEECGTQLLCHTFKEPHPELDGCPYETITETYCPVCEGGVAE